MRSSLRRANSWSPLQNSLPKMRTLSLCRNGSMHFPISSRQSDATSLVTKPIALRAVHYNHLVRRMDFWDLFHIVLCYDICLCIHFIDSRSGIDPSVWQEDVWHQIVDAYHMNTQHLLPGLAGVLPPRAPSSAAPTVASSSMVFSPQPCSFPSQFFAQAQSTPATSTPSGS